MDNATILSLLETLQEYFQAQAMLQSIMIDGYLELAHSRHISTGLLIPDVVISPDSEKRQISSDFRTIEANQAKLFVSGVSESCIDSVRTEFEKAVQSVLQLATIKHQLFAKCPSSTLNGHPNPKRPSDDDE